MNDLKIIKEQEVLGKEFKVYGTFESPLFLAKDVAEWIDYDISNVSKLVKNIDEDEKIMARINNTNIWLITEDGLVQIIAKSRKLTKQKKLELLKELNISDKNSNLIISCKEIEFFNKLETILEVFNIKYEKQYSVFNYKIDMFLPELNIAIEYDENNHKGYSYEKQELRQKEIEKELGCKFIRVSDEDSDELNIGLILKEIMEVK